MYDDDFQEERAAVEKREKFLTGKISNSIVDDEPYGRQPSSVLNKEGLDPDRALTEEELDEAIEEQMQGFANRFGVDVGDFKQMVGEHVRANRKLKKSKGFGVGVSQKKKRKSKSRKRK